MNFTYWTGFSKRRNSTAKPATTGTDKSCELKEDTSITAPTIKLQGHSYFNVTYGYIADFGRYYFVRDIRTVGPMTEIDLIVDVLATYKSDIMATSQYVERASYPTTGKNVPDPLNPPTNSVEIDDTLLMSLTDNIIDWDAQNSLIKDHFIMGVVGKSGVEYWSLNWSQLSNVFDNVFSLSFIQQFTSQFYDYRDCILSLKRVTYNPTGDTGQQIYLGEHGLVDSNNNPITATALNTSPIVDDSGLQLVSFEADGHLNARTYPYYPPYTSAAIYLPFVGIVPLDVHSIRASKVGVKVRVDKYTADIVYEVYTDDDITLGTYYGNCGADLPIAAQSYNPSALVSGAIQVGGGLAAAAIGSPVAGLGVASIGAGVAGITEGARIHSEVNGAISSFIGGYIRQSVHVFTYTHEPMNWDLENMKATQGVIVDEQVSLSSITGYVQCRNAHVATTGTESEKSELEALLNGGIFLE